MLGTALELPRETLLDSGQVRPFGSNAGAKRPPCGAFPCTRPELAPPPGSGGDATPKERPASSSGQQTRAVVFAKPLAEFEPLAARAKEGPARDRKGWLRERDGAKADLGPDGSGPACAPEGLEPGAAEEEAASTSASSWAPYGLPGDWSAGLAAPVSPGRPQFSKRINRTALLFVSVPKDQAHHFPAASKVLFVPRDSVSDLGFALRVTCSRPPRGAKFLCRGWSDFVRLHAIAVGDVVNFVMSIDDPLKWEFTIARLNRWAKPGEKPPPDGDDDEVRCMRCGRPDGADQLLLCDGTACGRACHTQCCRPALEGVPVGEWLCEVCQHGGSLAAGCCMLCGRRGEPGELLACAGRDCGRLCHLACARPPLTERPEGEWLCMLCRARPCIACGKRSELAKMLLCDGDVCGRACHLRCVQSSNVEVPDGEWFCKHCLRRRNTELVCMVCGKHDAQSPLLICDSRGCPRACHLECCTPPLKEVPSEAWFCTLCQCAGTFDAQCFRCNRRDSEAKLLLCDGFGCTRACHLRCCKPPLREVPVGDWFCDLCKLRGDRGGQAQLRAVVCMVCGGSSDEAELLLCDGPGCSRACHLGCCDPPLQRVPAGEWFCARCQAGCVTGADVPPPPSPGGTLQQSAARHLPCSPPPQDGLAARHGHAGPPKASPKRKVSNEGAKRCVAFGEALRLAGAAPRPARPPRR